MPVRAGTVTWKDTSAAASPFVIVAVRVTTASASPRAGRVTSPSGEITAGTELAHAMVEPCVPTVGRRRSVEVVSGRFRSSATRCTASAGDTSSVRTPQRAAPLSRRPEKVQTHSARFGSNCRDSSASITSPSRWSRMRLWPSRSQVPVSAPVTSPSWVRVTAWARCTSVSMSLGAWSTTDQVPTASARLVASEASPP